MEEDNWRPIWPIWLTQATNTETLGSVDVSMVAHLFTFGARGESNALRGLRMVSEIGKNGKDTIRSI